MRYQVGMAVGHLPRRIPNFPLKQSQSPHSQVRVNVPTNEPLPNNGRCVQEAHGKGEMDGETDEDADADGESTDGEDTDGEDTDSEENRNEDDDMDVVMFGH